MAIKVSIGTPVEPNPIAEVRAALPLRPLAGQVAVFRTKEGKTGWAKPKEIAFVGNDANTPAFIPPQGEE